MIFLTLAIFGIFAGLLTGAVGFGGGLVLLPAITYFYGIEIAVPVATIAQLMGSVTRAFVGRKKIEWKAAGEFLITAVPFTIIGSICFAKAPKVALTIILGVFLILFALLKITGVLHLKRSHKAMLIGGAVAGLTNGMISIYGPVSSAVFLTLNLPPIPYMASESVAASVMHIIKLIVYGRMDLLGGNIIPLGLLCGASMMLGNVEAMYLVRNVNTEKYQRIVAWAMIPLALWLIASTLFDF